MERLGSLVRGRGRSGGGAGSAMGGVMGKVIALTVVLASLGMVGGLVTTGILADRVYERSRAQLVEDYSTRTAQELDAQRTLAEQLAVTVASEPPVQQALAERDRQALLELMQPAFARLKADYGMAQLQFHLPPATSFLRLHKPEKYGDDLSAFRSTVVEANRKHLLVSGAEGGVAGLGVRAVAPVTYRGRHVGTVEFGTSLGDAFVRRLAERFGAQAVLYAPDKDDQVEAVATTLDRESAADAGALAAAMDGT